MNCLYLHKKSSSPLFNDCLIRMKFAMCKVRIYNTSVWRLRRGSDECRFRQKSCSLSTRHVEESFAHASVTLDAHAGTRQPSPAGQLVHVLEERETKLISFGSSWYSKPNPEDRINRKPDDQKNDWRTQNTKNQKTEKINSTLFKRHFTQIIYLIFGRSLFQFSISMVFIWSFTCLS